MSSDVAKLSKNLGIFDFDEEVVEVNLKNRLFVIILEVVVKSTSAGEEDLGDVISELNAVVLVIGEIDDFNWLGQIPMIEDYGGFLGFQFKIAIIHAGQLLGQLEGFSVAGL
jgi:hypothetical protein